MTGKVYLLPTYLDSENLECIPMETRQKAVSLKFLAVENVRTTRRYLKMIDRSVDIDAITFLEWDKHSAIRSKDMQSFIRPALNGHDMGILSEAGCPGIADPGQAIVAEAHNAGLTVVPMSGPSSIFLALMASGMNGQQFRFHGYLPVEEAKKRKFIQYMEREAIQRRETQIFMEAPYRNNKILQSLLCTLQPQTRLCVAANISSADESIRTKTIEAWRKEKIDLHKQPAIFLILQP
jgi:16S rRNA (cytidine1402-2'-O)-methyltransferase